MSTPPAPDGAATPADFVALRELDAAMPQGLEPAAVPFGWTSYVDLSDAELDLVRRCAGAGRFPRSPALLAHPDLRKLQGRCPRCDRDRALTSRTAFPGGPHVEWTCGACMGLVAEDGRELRQAYLLAELVEHQRARAHRYNAYDPLQPRWLLRSSDD